MLRFAVKRFGNSYSLIAYFVHIIVVAARRGNLVRIWQNILASISVNKENCPVGITLLRFTLALSVSKNQRFDVIDLDI